MSGKKHVETPKLKTTASMPSTMKLAENNKGQPRMLSNSIPNQGGKANDRPPSMEQSSVYYPPTSFYEYYYPGYGATFGQADDKGYYTAPGGSQTADSNGSLLYYLPGYGPYATEYLQQPYGSEAFSCYTYDGTYLGNGSSGGPANDKVGPTMGPSGSGKPNMAAKPSNTSNKAQTLPYSSKVQQSPNFITKSVYQNPLDKFGYGYDSSSLMKGYQPAAKFSSLGNQNMFLQYNPMSYYQPNGRSWDSNSNYKYKTRESFVKNGNTEALGELTRGPRSESRSTSPKMADSKGIDQQSIERNAYNLQEFKTEYDEAKFFVIKSYSEDDVHKCIKYGVWSSTPNGNKKLDAAFQEALAKAGGERGQKCPVFLFFSVNGSGQFVGVAEMMGRVDFAKNMDFWQLDKWTGSFPIKWHIIKDVPNTLLKHITLENNENRPVTYSRDTQEIGLKQGLEMLSIFKNYSIRTCVLDDFNFYEDREDKLKSKRNAKQANAQSAGEGAKAVGKTAEENTTTESTLVSLTQNLSLNSQPSKSAGLK